MAFPAEIFLVFLVLMLAAVVAYYELLRLEWTEAECRRLEAAEVELAQVLRLLDSPDVRVLMTRHSDRQHLFLEYSDALRRDVLLLLRFRDVGGKTLCLIGVFLVCYFLIRCKAYLFCGRDDLRFLSAMGLRLFRTVDQPTP